MLQKIIKDFSKYKLIQCLFALCMGALALVTLCFPLQEVSTYLLNEHFTFKENGFDFLDLDSIFMSETFMWGSTFIGIFCIIQIIISAITMIAAIASFFISDATTNKRLCRTLIILCLCFLLLYLLEGVAMNKVYSNAGYYLNADCVSDLINWEFDGLLVKETTTVTTFSYIPFIIGGVISITYFIIYFATKGTTEKRPRKDKITYQKQIAEILKMYKDLLDNGIITQEEFDKEKKKYFD